DPAHGAESRAEFVLEAREHHLRDAGIDLSHEGADAHGGDDAPPIARQTCYDLHRRRLATLQDCIAQRGDRDGTVRSIIHVASSFRAGPTGPNLPDHHNTLSLPLFSRTVLNCSLNLKTAGVINHGFVGYDQ